MRRIPLFLFILLSLSIQAETESSDVGPYRVTSTEKNEMRIINSGFGSLYARVDMIRRAQKSIDLESYIFDMDTSGRIILKELAEAAKRGVKVRVLVDQLPFGFQFNDYISDELKNKGIEIRYYNPASKLNLTDVQFRNHRKLMVRDGEEAITGGRNISDSYFDLSKRFNFLDRDTTVEGPIVKSMDKTFDNFWNSKATEAPKKPIEPFLNPSEESGEFSYRVAKDAFDKGKASAARIFASNKEDDRILSLLMKEGKESFLSHEKRVCPEVSFASDREGARFRETLKPEAYARDYRFVRQEITKWLDQKVKDEVIVDTPYFLKTPLTDKFLDFIQRKKAKVKLFTNSLASTDAIHVSSVFSSSVSAYTAYDDFKVYVYKGNYSGEGKLPDAGQENAAWGTHSKTLVFGPDAFMIGSYNIDNRSRYFNTELAIFCSGSPELTKDIKDNIEKRTHNSTKLSTDGSAEDCDPVQNVGPIKKLMYYLVKIPSHLLQDLL